MPSATFTLHTTHCERFIQICLSCQEPIHKAEMEQHANEVHKVIDCKDCKEKIERGAENDHLVSILVSDAKVKLINIVMVIIWNFP